MEHILTSILRTCAAYIILLFASFWLGKQMNSGNNHHNFALAITVGSIIANLGFDTNLKFFPMLASFLALILMYFFCSIISLKSRRFRIWISGEPTVIIENGKILDKNMRKIRYSLDDLLQQLREQGIFDLFEVEYAILEVSGKLSVMKKKNYQSVSKMDVNVTGMSSLIHLPRELVMDGVEVEKNFNSVYTRKWLEQELSGRNLQMKDIQYAVISSTGTLFIDLLDDQLESPLDRE
ncbi:DUF421 domain-containing protein [Neobacillus sp. LXY-1]|uniref:DUF421 domain-containing protein n=1 Tax=Neobacillus sp. LXY-1 TaxID=3379133 RepID=UPI003EDFBE13